MIKIILIEDHTIIRDGIKSILENESDIKILGEANDGREGVKLALSEKPDIVITDIGMPGMNGIEATRQLKKEIPGIKIIALSMYSDKHIVLGIIRAGASAYLLKESTSSELVKAIRTVYLGHKYLSQRISDIVMDDLSSPDIDPNKAGVDILTGRESEILQLLAEGNSTVKIGKILFISPKTVESHRANIMEKLNIHNVPELTKYAIRVGLTSLNE